MWYFITLPVTNGISERFRWKCSSGSRPGCLVPLWCFRPTAPCADTEMALLAELALFFLRLGFILSTDAGLAVSNWVSLCNQHTKSSKAEDNKNFTDYQSSYRDLGRDEQWKPLSTTNTSPVPEYIIKSYSPKTVVGPTDESNFIYRVLY